MELYKTDGLTIGYKKTFGETILGENFELRLSKGEMVCVLGPNGVGKSTLLKTMAGLHTPLMGKAYLMGMDVHGLRKDQLARKVAVVLTERIDAVSMTGFEFVSLGRYPYTGGLGKLRERDINVVLKVMRETGTIEFRDIAVGKLSDGERQKVLVARALAQEPVLLILDEPMIFLDITRKFELFQMLRTLSVQKKMSILLSTHDIDTALRFADRLWLFGSEKKITAGSPEDLMLKKAVHDLFKDPLIQYDKTNGCFLQKPQFIKKAYLVGEEDYIYWTRRVLERKGFAVSLNQSDGTLKVQVQLEDGLPVWKVVYQDGRNVFHSLLEMGDFLEMIREDCLKN
ncbi:MAG: ABC transporter ATP-binding protein [Deltaproteobacteria bacterium]|nr:ABC transporter ATP-binding protein [Deltaproteobacteria bacterium]